MNIDLIIKVLLFSLMPFTFILIGGFTGIMINVKSKVRSFILHLAGGVIFAVVTVELLPNILSTKEVVPITIGFFIGLGLMLLIKYITRKSEKTHKEEVRKSEKNDDDKKSLPMSLLLGIGIDLFIDGLLLGIGFAAGETEGLMLCVALSIEILALGIVVATELKQENHKSRQIIKSILIFAFIFVGGSLFGSIFTNFLSGTILIGVIAFGLSALIYLVTEELLVEAHEEKDTPLNTAIFFVGFFIFMMIAILN